MQKVSYKITIGGWSINSADSPQTELTELMISYFLKTPNCICQITVYAPSPQQPSLLDQAVTEATSALGLGDSNGEESFSIQVRGNNIKPDDPITIELTSGNKSGKIMTAEVNSICSTLGQTTISGTTGMQKLVSNRLNQIYENQSLKQIISDLASQVGVSTGEIEEGSTYPYFVVNETKNVFAHIKELAMRDGMDFYFNTDNKLTLQKFTKSSADHTFYYGIDVLDLQLKQHKPNNNLVRVYGESPASNQGTDTAHWLVKDISPFKSEVGDGSSVLALQDGAVRTKDAADQLAIAKLGAIKDQSSYGQLKLIGNSTVKLADAIEIKNVPKPELNGLFKVTSLRHELSKQTGYVTYVGFTGQGGSEAAGGLLGAVGDLAGAIGL